MAAVTQLVSPEGLLKWYNAGKLVGVPSQDGDQIYHLCFQKLPKEESTYLRLDFSAASLQSKEPYDKVISLFQKCNCGLVLQVNNPEWSPVISINFIG